MRAVVAGGLGEPSMTPESVAIARHEDRRSAQRSLPRHIDNIADLGPYELHDARDQQQPHQHPIAFW